jgi:hypothetical protein
MKNPPMMVMGIPNDQEYLAAIGMLALCHAQWDSILRMTVKSIRGVDIPTAFKETPRGSALLRDLVLKEAKKKLAQGDPAIAQLENLLGRGQDLTEDRNLVIHSIVAKPLDSHEEFLMRDEKLNWSKLPTAADLIALANQVAQITKELNDSRLSGFLHAALSNAS